MSSASLSSSPIDNGENESTTIESTKPKRLPRSAKKRLRYERIRQQRKQTRKKKKNPNSSHPSSSITIPSDASESKFSLLEISLYHYCFSLVLTEQVTSMTGKIFKRTANERLAEINQDSTTTIICIDCAYNQSMSNKVKLYHSIENNQLIKKIFLIIGNC